MTWIEIISALLGLTCVFLAGRNSKVNFWVGYAYNIFLFVLFWSATGAGRTPGRTSAAPPTKSGSRSAT